MYREITDLETKVKEEDSMEDSDDVMSSRAVLKGKTRLLNTRTFHSQCGMLEARIRFVPFGGIVSHYLDQSPVRPLIHLLYRFLKYRVSFLLTLTIGGVFLRHRRNSNEC
jgi:hypothetical protein